MSKKFLCALLFLLMFVNSAFARHKVGTIEMTNVTPEILGEFALRELDQGNVNVFGKSEPPTFAFFRTINAVRLSLNNGDIDEILCPEFEGDFIVKTNPDFEIKCVIRNLRGSFVFAFLDDHKALRDEFNEALKTLRGNMTLDRLADEYYKDFDLKKPAVEFAKYDGADTIKIAVTGDRPPIDLITADGKATGFNTAILAEIGKMLHKNIEIIQVDSGARVPALSSGRADVIFWVMMFDSEVDDFVNADKPASVIVSDPYIKWNNFVHVGLKNK